MIAKKADGSWYGWGFNNGPQTGHITADYTRIVTNGGYCALSTDVTKPIKCGGNTYYTANDPNWNEPTDTGYVRLYAAGESFFALKADGTLTAWGDSTFLAGVQASAIPPSTKRQ